MTSHEHHGAPCRSLDRCSAFAFVLAIFIVLLTSIQALQLPQLQQLQPRDLIFWPLVSSNADVRTFWFFLSLDFSFPEDSTKSVPHSSYVSVPFVQVRCDCTNDSSAAGSTIACEAWPLGRVYNGRLSSFRYEQGVWLPESDHVHCSPSHARHAIRQLRLIIRSPYHASGKHIQDRLRQLLSKYQSPR